jgi:hypothetical protein
MRFGLPDAYTFARVLERYPTATEIRWLSMGRRETRPKTPDSACRYGLDRFEVIDETPQ